MEFMHIKRVQQQHGEDKIIIWSWQNR